MASLILRIQDISLDIEPATDPSTLLEAEAITWIRKTHGFLAMSIEVVIQDGTAIFSLPEENA